MLAKRIIPCLDVNGGRVVKGIRFVSLVDAGDPAAVLGETEYGVSYPSVVARGNVCGVQFHPEKSQAAGLRLLKNFAEAGARRAG